MLGTPAQVRVPDVSCPAESMFFVYAKRGPFRRRATAGLALLRTWTIRCLEGEAGWAARILRDLPAAGVEVIDDLLAHYALSDLPAQPADERLVNGGADRDAKNADRDAKNIGVRCTDNRTVQVQSKSRC